MLKVTDYANGLPIGDGKTFAFWAFKQAIDAAVSYREPLFIPHGQYMIEQTLTIPDYLDVWGLGRASELIHCPGLLGPVLFMHSATGARLRDFSISGGIGREPAGSSPYLTLNHDQNGYIGPEACFGGIGCHVSGLFLTEWNHVAALVYGQDLTVERSYTLRTPPSFYKPDSGLSASRDLGGSYGWLTPEHLYCSGLRMIDCGARGVRGPAAFVGGVRGAIVRFTADDCHHEYLPRNDDPGGFTSGGGQIALSHTWSGYGPKGNQQPQHWLIDTPFVKPSTGPATVGVEIHKAWAVDVRSPMIMGVKVGMSIRESRMIRVQGGTIGGTAISGLNIADSTFVDVATGFEACNTAIRVTGASQNIDTRKSSFYANVLSVDADPSVVGLIR